MLARGEEAHEIDVGPVSSDSWQAADYGTAHLLRDAQRAMSRALATRISTMSVSIGQWYFLRALWEEDGLTQRELSHRVGMMEPTTVTALNSMEKRGLVERVRNPRDRRKMNIFLTEKGRSLRDKLMPCEDEVNKVAVAGLSESDVEALERSLRQILQNMAENGG
ncbi:MAG: winged helix-turn-helix transcriptional regulator [Rhodospirillaceae bacterium]|nr:winged helix-turn-helix transcriptional regulator [Rhodospirillaceae bacterium]